jgi:hypothetical protein
MDGSSMITVTVTNASGSVDDAFDFVAAQTNASFTPCSGAGCTVGP